MRKLPLLLLLICLVKESAAQITYTFTGNGNWTVVTNWSNNLIPPSVLPAGDTIIISPAAGDSCVLNTPQTISTGASLIIAPGAVFIIREGMVTQEPVLADSTFTDPRDGQVYTFRHIGTQVWMTKNLNYATASGSWCCDDNGYHCAVYGRLYDWNTALTIAPPPGWHLPSDAEWQIIINELGGEGAAGGKMKETGTAHWQGSPFSGADNQSRFSAIPGGHRNTDGLFYGISNYGNWWSSTGYDLTNAWFYLLSYDNASVFRTYGGNGSKASGFAVRCVRDNIVMPVVYTMGITNLSSSSVSCGGIIISKGGSPVTTSGLVWDTLPNPTITLSTKTINVVLSDTFVNDITTLQTGKTYYVRAYATNNTGTSYGNAISFTIGVPLVITTTVINITDTTAIAGGIIPNNGISPVTSSGLVWNTLPHPTTALLNKTTNVLLTDTFSNNIAGLQAGKTYYLRAYATNSLGTAYGNEISFATPINPDSTFTDPRDGQLYTFRHIGTQVWMTKNLNYVTIANSWCYDNNAASCTAYGRLYTWDTALTATPPGWHLPDSAEWQILINYFGGNDFGGDKMKEIGTAHWITPNRYADNSIGFTGLPGGNRDYSSGSFFGIGNYSYWWSATKRDSGYAWGCTLYNIYPATGMSYNSKTYGFSVRCIRDTPVAPLPVLITNAVMNVTNNSATSGATFITGGSSPVLAAGLVWDTFPHPTIALPTKTLNATTTGTFNDNISGLQAGKTYYLRAYATNGAGTGYGNEISFTTTGVPVVITNVVSNITVGSATSGGIITTNGGSIVTLTGLVWDTLPHPINTLSTKTVNNLVTDTFSNVITGLHAGRTYYVRAYATNSAATGYGNEMNFTTADSTFIDPRDGQVYTFRHTGSQVWMTKNLNYVTSSGSWCYNNNVASCDVYGRLYTWDTALAVAPPGWHLPDNTEWQTLIDFLGGSNIAGGSMKATRLWLTPNTGATDSSGFSALPGGYRHSNGTFNNLGDYGHWWSSTENNTTSAWFFYLSSYFADVVKNSGGSKAYGYSVRCIRDY